jgi:hypothetical protein
LDARRAAAAVRIQRTSFPREPSNDYTGYGFVAADRILHIYHYLDPLDHTRYQTYYSVGDNEMRLRSQELIVYSADNQFALTKAIRCLSN